MRHGAQAKLFDVPAALPNGFIYRPDFLTRDEEEILLAYFNTLPLAHPIYKDEYEAKRRHIGFGWGWDYEREKLIPGEPLPHFLQGVQRKIAKWLQIPPQRVAEALINEYTPGSAIGWHVDNEGFEKIVGISLSGWCRMRLRPVRSRVRAARPASNGMRPARNKDDVVSLELEPRSAYIMQGQARWQWQHSIPPVQDLRYSITFRTLPERVII